VRTTSPNEAHVVVVARQLGAHEPVQAQRQAAGRVGQLRAHALAVVVVADGLPAVEDVELARPAVAEWVGQLQSGLVVGRQLPQPGPRVVPVVLRLERLHADVAGIDASLQQQPAADTRLPLHRGLDDVLPDFRPDERARGLEAVDDLGGRAEAERQAEAHGVGVQREVHLGQVHAELVVPLGRGADAGKEVRVVGRAIPVVGVVRVDEAAHAQRGGEGLGEGDGSGIGS
jgi:hypothetical protein